MSETDMAYINYGVSDKMGALIQEQNEKRMLEHPICEICHERNSVRITPIGTLRASCLECIDGIRKMLADDLKRRLESEDDY